MEIRRSGTGLPDTLPRLARRYLRTSTPSSVHWQNNTYPPSCLDDVPVTYDVCQIRPVGDLDYIFMIIPKFVNIKTLAIIMNFAPDWRAVFFVFHLSLICFSEL